MRKYYLAIDIGASSGRHIVGFNDGNRIVLDEVYRFPNGMIRSDGDLIWDTEKLFSEIVEGIKLCLQKYGVIESLAIDTWGVDYALLKGDKLITPVYAYRSDRTKTAIEQVHNIIPPKELYNKTGEQFQAFNTVYQLFADKISGRLYGATDFLMIPEYFNYLLTGNKVKEYTDATTGALVNVKTKEFDKDITSVLGLPDILFKKLHYAGELVGDLKSEIQQKVGGNIKVRLCASHDTACAFEAIETDENAVLISSGTWSLVGVKIKSANTDEKSFLSNFANEGGVGYFRYLKNVMGMWIVNECCKELNISVVDAVEKARRSSYSRVFNVNDDSVVAPLSMVGAIETLLGEKVSQDELFASIYHSLAAAYTEVIRNIEENLNITVSKIYIVGGGAKNRYLNELTEKISNKQVFALPIEATAVGNIKTQMRG